MDVGEKGVASDNWLPHNHVERMHKTEGPFLPFHVHDVGAFRQIHGL